MNAFEVFDDLVNSRDVRSLLISYEKLNELFFLNEFVKSFEYFLRLKKCLQKSKQILKFNKISSIIQKLEKRSQLKVYHQNRALNGQRVLVIGGGISGLRVAIELLLLGAQVTCVEKRDTFSRNNVIHLWPNVISDLRLLAAKRFYGRFCVGSIDHVAIRQIQLILLKIALIFGLKFCPNVTFDKLCPNLMTTSDDTCDDSRRHVCRCCCHSHGFGDGAVAHFTDSLSGEPFEGLRNQFFDIIIGSDGRRNTLFQDFPRKEFRGKLAIAITANFVNRRTEAEVQTQEISGVSYIYAQKWFKDLLRETGIQLENICYYRDETHYYVMTATKQSLLSRKVLIKDLNETNLLLDENNIDREELLRYAKDAAEWTSGLRGLEFAKNAVNSPDVALFDFTSVYAARNASRAKRVRITCCSPETEEKYVLMLLTGDSLLEPFWPTGSGAGRGFLSALDAAWTALRWTERVVRAPPEADLFERMSEVIAERESVYRLLAQTTPENVSSKDFSLSPQNRYQNYKRDAREVTLQIRHLIGHSHQPITERDSLAAKRARRATVAVTTRDIQNSQSEKDLEEMEFELIKRDLEIKRLEENSRLKEKTQWLLGQHSTTTDVKQQTDDRRQKETTVRPKKKEEIVNRAQHLEEILYSENCFEGKLQKVGKIEENDWNFRVWEKNQFFGEKPEKKVNKVLENSKEILESRKHQIEAKLRPERGQNSDKRDKKLESKEWIRKMAEELNERMGTKAVVVESASPVVSSLPQCVRCGLEVSAVDRISVSGEVLHRSCLRCSKCGISLRLNEFRTELKFLCIYCLKNNSKFSETNDLIKKKENFLKEIQKIDFRERIEFENKETTLDDKCDDSRQNSDIQVISKTALNAQTDDTNDSQSSDDLTFDLTESEDNSSEIDSSEEWETTSDDNDDNPSDDTHNTTVRETTAVAMKETTPQTTTASIPSICVTRDPTTEDVNDNHNRTDANDNSVTTPVVRYSGAFTEKLFRSKSQPMLAFRRGLKVFNKEIELCPSDEPSEDEEMLFADIGGLGGLAFSPVRGVKAPIIEFKDI